MPSNKNFKRRVRGRMAVTGERYTKAREQIRATGGGNPHRVPGWHLAGSRPAEYEIGLETDLTYRSRRVAYLKSIVDRSAGFGTIMQTISSENYQDRRVMLSAWIQGAELDGWAGLWMRVDGPNSNVPLAFDNMQRRALRGTFGWQKAQVVLDVAAEAVDIAFGVLLEGGGTDRMADFRLEIVDASVPVTNTASIHREPRNLDFSLDRELD